MKKKTRIPSFLPRADRLATVRLRLPGPLRRRWNHAPDAEFLVTETQDGLLIRPADPPLTRLYVEPTSDCNLGCRTCPRHTWEEPTATLSGEHFDRILRDLPNISTLRTVSFWGFGEPLLHPGLPEMIRRVHALGLRTEIVTNGILLTPELSEALIRAGLDALVVSLDGATPEAHADIRPGADFNAVRENVLALHTARKILHRENPEIGIEFVAMRRNIEQLPELPHLARSLSASFVIVTNLLPHTEELKDDILYWLVATGATPPHRSRWNPELILPRLDIRRENKDPIARLLVNADAAGFRRALLPDPDPCCPFFREGALVVASDGSITPCLALLHSQTCYILDRRKSIRRYVLGNLSNRTLRDVWNDAEFRKFRRRVLEFDFSPCVQCGGCESAEANLEDCYGNPFPVCGDCLWPRGILLCP